MIRIELSPNDKKDLLQLIDICKQHKEIFVYNHTNYVNWWTLRLEQLEKVINGYQYNSYVKSSLETFDRSMDQQEKIHQYYLNRLEKELLDVPDSK